MRDGVALWRPLSLAGQIHKMIPVNPLRIITYNCNNSKLNTTMCIFYGTYINLIVCSPYYLKTLRIEQNIHHFADNIFRCIFLRVKFDILIKISLKFAPKGVIVVNSALVQVIAWCLTHWGWDKIVIILQTTFAKAFFLVKMYEFCLRLHWRLFLRVQLTLFQHWFR